MTQREETSIEDPGFFALFWNDTKGIRDRECALL
jgi:hypothetical protein